MTSVLPKDAAALKAIAQELAGQDADYIEQFLRELLADPVRIASPQSARRNARRSGRSRSRAADSPMQQGV